jgi:hypothetical protein
MRLPSLAFAFGLALAGPAFAQVQPSTPGAGPAGSVGSTVTGGLPDRTASTSAVGRTKPPGAPIGDGLGTRPDLEEKSRQLDRKINTGICSGCK